MSIAETIRKIHKDNPTTKVVIVCEPGEMNWEKKTRGPGKIEVQLRLDSNRGFYSEEISLRGSDERISAVIHKLYLRAVKGALESSKSELKNLVEKAIAAKKAVKAADHEVAEQQRMIEKTEALLTNGG